jgi:hypothetical protein
MRWGAISDPIIKAGDLALQYLASVNELSIMRKYAQDMVPRQTSQSRNS